MSEKSKFEMFLTELLKYQRNYPTMKWLDEEQARRRKEREDESEKKAQLSMDEPPNEHKEE